jgi:hypothetical protein
MSWTRRGLVWGPDGLSALAQHYAILPTPIFDERTRLITVYFASTDRDRYGRLFSVNVAPENPTKLVGSIRGPLLDLGELGTFDDCGVNPSSVVRCGNELRLYYVGYQRSHRVPYLLLGGLAVRGEGEPTFRRLQRTPVFERTDLEPWIRSAPCVLKRSDGWHAWYVSASAWETHEDGLFRGRAMPRYSLRHAVSTDGITWTAVSGELLDRQDDEFGFGRPWVVEEAGIFRMWFSVRRRSVSYRVGYAESVDGLVWKRFSDEPQLEVAATGWDSEMICYAAVMTTDGLDFMFYNGNRNGESGFGVATRPHIGPRLGAHVP